MQQTYVWDPLARLFHWSLVVAITASVLTSETSMSWHTTIGYLTVTLIAFRAIWGLIGSKHARFSSFPPSPSAAMGQFTDMVTGRRRVHKGHSPAGALMVYNLLLTVTALGATGYWADSFTGSSAHLMEEVHEALFSWLCLSILVHVLAVVFESRRLNIGLVRAMFTGYKTENH